MHDSILEQSLLGAMLADSSLVENVGISAGDFQTHYHAQVYQKICDLIANRRPVDVVSVASEFNGAGHLDKLCSMMQLPLSTKSAEAYAEKIKQSARNRKAKQVLTEALENIGSDHAIEFAIRDLMALQSTAKNYEYSAKEIVAAAIDKIEECMNANGMVGINTGLNGLNSSLGGFHKSDLVVIGARPAVGKTALLLNLALSCNAPCLLISAEQGVEQIGGRLISMDGQVSAHKMRSGKLVDEDFRNIVSSGVKIGNKKLWAFDKPAPTIEEICNVARKFKHHEYIGAVYIDYLQRIKSDGFNRRDQVANVVMTLKELARELQVPVICLAQVRREVESRDNKRPTMADLKEAGEIEQEADQIIMLYRDEVYDEETADIGIAELNVVKNRHGPIGNLRFGWDGQYMRFSDIKEF